MVPALDNLFEAADNALKKYTQNIDILAENYFIDPSDSFIDMPHFKLHMLGMSYILNGNVLLTGEPGFGKTTAAKLVLTGMTGLPYDLFERAQFEGHPDQTSATITGLPEFHKMQTTGSVTVWQPGWYLPGMVLDEINRLPDGKQSMLLTSVDLGTVQSPMGHTLQRGKMPFFGTANYQDSGNGLMIPPLLDRFDISVEFGYIGPHHRDAILKGSAAIRNDLMNPDMTIDLLQELRDVDAINTQREFDEVVGNKFEYVEERRLDNIKELTSRTGLEPLTNDEILAIRSGFDAMSWLNQQSDVKTNRAADGLMFFDLMESAFNSTPKYGIKRSSDTVDTSNDSVSGKVHNSFSPRASKAVEQYARAFAYMQGHREHIGKEYIVATTPYILSHRLKPHEDFERDLWNFEWSTSGPANFELSTKLMSMLETQYADVEGDLGLIYQYQDHLRNEKSGGKPILNATQITQAREILGFEASYKPDGTPNNEKSDIALIQYMSGVVRKEIEDANLLP